MMREEEEEEEEEERKTMKNNRVAGRKGVGDGVNTIRRWAR